MDNGEKTSLFRKEALEHIATPEQLNQAIAITTAKSWILLLTLSALVFFIFLWAIFGTINTRVEGQGIILSSSQGLYNAVAPKGEGQVAEIVVNIGDAVKANQVVANLSSSYLSNQITAARQAIAEFTQKYEQLQHDSQIAIAKRHDELLKQNAIQQKIIDDQKSNLEYVKKLMKIREDAYAKGLVVMHEVAVSKQDYYSTQNAIDNAQAQIVHNQLDETAFNDEWNERLRQLDIKIKEKKQELESLIAQQQSGSHVYSPISGIVTNISAQVGDMVKDGDPVMSIVPQKQDLDIIAYVPVTQGKKIEENMRALVTPSIIKKEEFGSMVGHVTRVSEYPSTASSMEATLKNQDLVKQLMEKQLPMEIRIHLETDPSTYSGFKWTSAGGPPQKITPGTLVETSIIVRKQAPVSLVIPAIRKLFGG